MKTGNWLITISLSLSMLFLLGTLAIIPPAPVTAGPQPQATVEPSPRYGHSLVTISDTVYLFGGTDIPPTQGIRSDRLHPAGNLYNDLWAYNDSTGWKQIEPNGLVPPPRHSHGATGIGNWIWIFGGIDNGNTVRNDIWACDPVTNQWTQKSWTGPYNAPHVYENTLTSIGNEYLYLYGGRDQNGNLRTASYRYNVNTGEASSLWAPNGPGARAGHSAIGRFDRIYLFGGYSGEPPTYQNDLWVLDTESGIWIKLEPSGDPVYGFPVPRAHATMIPYGDQILLLYGDNGGQPFNDAWIFHPQENRWEYATRRVGDILSRTRSAGAPLDSETSEQARAAQTSNQAILIFGGLHDGTPIAETSILQPIDRLYLPLVTR